MRCVWMLLAGMFVLLVGQPAWGQREAPARPTKSAADLPDVAKTELTLEKLESPPAREIEFERSDRELLKRMTRLDPKLLEQKYVAVVRLAHAKPSEGSRVGVLRLVDLRSNHPAIASGPLVKLQTLLGTQLNSGARWEVDSAQNVFERFIDHVPAKQLPTKEQLAFFKSDDVIIGGQYIQVRNHVDSKYTEIQILAPTVEVAEERAKTLLRLLDWGGARAIQTAMFEYRTTWARDWTETRSQLVAVEKQIDEAQKQLATYAGFTSDMLASLNQQQIQLDVALVTAKARLTTCEKLLGELPGGAARTKVEELKVATEIEVVGIEAGQTRTGELLKSMRAKEELSNQLKELGVQRERLSRRLTGHTNALAEIDAVISQNAPQPLVDGKVIIQPIKWTDGSN